MWQIHVVDLLLEESPVQQETGSYPECVREQTGLFFLAHRSLIYFSKALFALHSLFFQKFPYSFWHLCHSFVKRACPATSPCRWPVSSWDISVYVRRMKRGRKSMALTRAWVCRALVGLSAINMVGTWHTETSSGLTAGKILENFCQHFKEHWLA